MANTTNLSGSKRGSFGGTLSRCRQAEIVNGELVTMTPSGGLHRYAVSAIHASLFDYARRTKRG